MVPCRAKDVRSGKTHAFKFSDTQRNSNFTQRDTGKRQGTQPLQSSSCHIRHWVSTRKSPTPSPS